MKVILKFSMATLATLAVFFMGYVTAVALNYVSMASTAQDVNQSRIAEDEIIKLTNEYRIKKGMAPLVKAEKLTASAIMKAQDMIAKNYWSHVSPDGTEPWYWLKTVNYMYLRSGENLAYGFATSSGMVDAWKRSPSHEANLSGDYTEIGVGVIHGVNYQGKVNQTVIVAHYGAR